MSELEYSNIWTRIQGSDQAALKALFQDQFPSVCQAIYRLVKDQHLTRDLAQNVFIKLWEKREDLQITSSLPAYLRRMGTNEALMHLRSKKSWSTDIDEIPDQVDERSPEDEMLGGELSGQITEAIDALPPRCQTIFKLSRYEELSYREIAHELSLSVKTVENQMGKALKLLRVQVGAYLNDP
ncbi:MAG: RNA polymerase sigma-70 factor [Bacteroidetes bacterium]|nr:RNA polymerase sigma-70 factor [Bacteroidota bacterium]